ncbi:MAG TPA: MBL fold metallo-hydrolase [Flavobacteriales bacterium]|jgi:phosphoribosyl 1,2-cyclic phosphate phosphodiesterase|nr:MBL fold metallo-hydrolase [Flavobacteriales bacterium]
MKVTFLGTGTSQGVPVIACECKVCKSKDQKDKRLRSSVLIEDNGVSIVIDTGPDFRQQMLREDARNLAAVLLTHEHKDHVAGMDDVRAFNFTQRRPMPIYADQRTQKAVLRDFYYAFSPNPYPGVPRLDLIEVGSSPFYIEHLKVIPLDVMHLKMPVKAFRINNFTYVTDANYIDDVEMEKMIGSEVLVINALKREKHISHFNLDEAIEVINRINPRRAFITHISHQMGFHKEVASTLAAGIGLAYDGLTIEL